MNTNSGRCARNNTKKPGEKPEESWDNSELLQKDACTPA